LPLLGLSLYLLFNEYAFSKAKCSNTAKRAGSVRSSNISDVQLLQKKANAPAHDDDMGRVIAIRIALGIKKTNITTGTIILRDD
jgi:hypothetical protein